MKKIQLLMLSIILAISANAQWTRTNVDTMDTGVEAMCEHNGSLYAAIYNQGLIKYDNATSQWLEVADNLPPTGNSAHLVRMASVGNYLYAFVNDQFHASTTIYRSTDGGITFATDTVGQPRNGPFPSSTAGYTSIVHGVFVLDGQLFCEMGGAGITKKPSDAAWTTLTDPIIKFAASWASYNHTWYVEAGNKILTSADSGATWLTPANAGFSPGFGISRMSVDPTSGRIYVSNTANQFTVQKIFYSDNEGASWDSIAINQYTGNSYINGIPQSVQGMIGVGSTIHIMLTNNAANTLPDVLTSTDGGATFSKDTVGLSNDQFGAGGFVNFVYFDNKVWFAPNGPDIYIQGGSVGVKNIAKLNSKVYPNPVSHSVTIENEFAISNISVTNILGNTIMNESPKSKKHSIDISTLPSGMYFVTITANNQTQTVKVVKK